MMQTFNTKSPRQKNHWPDYRGSYSMHMSEKQNQMMAQLCLDLDIRPLIVWEEFFEEPYAKENWKQISVNAASEIIGWLLNIKRTEQALARKMARTEQQQHEWEMYPDGKL